jgi:hypothetical protein
MKLFTSQTWRHIIVGSIVMLLTYGVFQINPQWLQGNILINETNLPSDTRLIYIPEVTADIDDTPVFSVKMRTDEAISGFSLKIHDFPELLDGMFDVELHSNLTSSYFSQYKSPAGLEYDASSNTYTLEDVYLDMTYPVQIAENQTIEIATITFNTPVTVAHIGIHPFKVDLLSSGHINEVQDIYGDDLVFNTHNGSLIVIDNSPAPVITINDASSPEGNIATNQGNTSPQSLSYIWGEKADRTTTTATPISPILNHEIDHAAEVVQDSQDNVYVLSIQGLAQTGPYYDIVMFNANGTRLREYNMHGWEPTIQVDNSDNLIIGAYTQQRPEDLDPTSGVDSKWAPSCANNSNYAYITTVDSQGNYLWSKYIDQSGGVVCSTKISDIEVDDQNNIFVSLYASGRYNLSGTIVPTSSQSGMAIVKYDALGNYQWHQFWDNALSGIAGSKHTYDMEIKNNKIYIEGQYQAQSGGGGVDFDFTNSSVTTPTNTYQGITNEIAPGHSFIMKLSDGGSTPTFDWVKTIGQTELIELIVSGNQIYATGHIDTGSSTVALLRTYDLNGNALNTQTLNYAIGEYSHILDATVHDNTLMLVGRSRQDIDLDPSQTGDEFVYSGDGNCPNYLFSGNGNCENFFLAMYDQSLNYTEEVYQWGGSNADRYAHISSNGSGRIYVAADIGQNGGLSVDEEMDFTGGSDIETLTYIRAGVSALNYTSTTPTSNQMMFTVTQTGANNTPFTINWQTNADTATSNIDYSANMGSLTFPATTSITQTHQIFIDILADNIQELDEYFFVNLTTNDTNVIIQDNQGIGTILDDDAIATIVDPVTQLLITDYNTATEELTFQWRIHTSRKKNV